MAPIFDLDFIAIVKNGRRVISPSGRFRRLGEVECRDCGVTVPPSAEGGLLSAGPAGPAAARAPGLSEEVAQALERVLGRGAAR